MVASDSRLWLADPFREPSGPVGSQLPSTFHGPEWVRTEGDAAVKLCRACGLELLPWQQLVVRNALGRSQDGRFAAFEVGLLVPRQNGKNVVLLAIELWHLFMVADSHQIVHTAHQFKTARSAFRDLVKIIEDNAFLRGRVASITSSTEQTAIVLNNGDRIDFVARAGGSGRGLSGDLVVLDEAYQLSEDTMSDLLPTLSARPSPQLWYTSSTGFDYSTVLREVRDRGVEHPENNKHLLLLEWSADLKEVDWRSVEAVQASNPSLGWFQSWDWIQEVDLRSMQEDAYKRERLGVWADASTDAVIGVDLWAGCLASPEVMVGAVVKRRSLALEVTRDRDLAVLAGAALLADGRVVVDIIAAKPGVSWVQDEVARVFRKFKPDAGVVLDSFGAAAALAPRLQENGVSVSPAITRDVTTATADFYDRIVAVTPDGDPDPQLVHSSHPLLDDAAHTARRRLVGSSQTAWTWAQFGEVPVEPLRAVTLAAHGLVMDPVGKKRSGVVI